MALIDGILGGLAVAAVGVLVKIPSDIRRHDRLIAERNDDLALWLADEHQAFGWERRRIMNDLSARGALRSGERLYELALQKERALHQYRDQERQTRRFVAELEERETIAHAVFRVLLRRRFPELGTPRVARPLLDSWRAPEGYEGSPVRQIDDPTERSLRGVLDELALAPEEMSPGGA